MPEAVLIDRPKRTRRRAPRGRREPRPLEQIPVWSPLTVGADGEPGGSSGEVGLDGLLGGLNREQLRAVTHDSGPILVVAGAGTGKTQVVTRRIAWLIATRHARPGEILGLTFTDKAAQEMQTRVDQLVPYGRADAAISTFHAFGDRLIRDYALELGYPPDVRVLSRAEVIVFLRERLFEFDLSAFRPLGDPTRFLGALASHFSRLKDEDISPADYLAFAEREAGVAERLATVTSGGNATAAARETAAAAGEAASRRLELARAYACQQELLGAAGFIDFGDQVSIALGLLRNSASARREIRSRFGYILVDEFQDTNRAQAELVWILAEPHRNVMVVGDDDQSIYRFRGAATSNIEAFRERFGRPRLVVLRRNYRSRAGILQASHRLIRHNGSTRLEVRAGIDKRLRAQRGESVPGRRVAAIQDRSFRTGTDEADWVAGEIARRIEAGARPRDHAVLLRSNAEADPVLRSLNQARVPWRFSGASGLYRRPEVKILLAFLRTVADPASSADLYALATSDVYGLGGEDLSTLAGAARRRNRSLWEVLEELDRQPGLLRLGAGTRRSIAHLVADVRRFTDLGHRRSAGEVLFEYLKHSGWLARLADPASAEDEALGNVARFFEVIRAHGALLDDDRIAFVARHLQTLIDGGDEPMLADIDDGDVISVLTVHRAKGLEFPTVFVVGLVDGRFPARHRREAIGLPDELLEAVPPVENPHLAEERRLFYVAMTRARDELILSHAADYGGRRAWRVSPFVAEALDAPGSLLRGQGEAPVAIGSLPEAGSEQRVPVSARPSPHEPLTLSFNQVDDYLTCPLRYRFAHIARVPVSPHHSLVYGAALHRAVQEFHRRQGRGEAMTEHELLAAFDAAWSSEGFLTREHEEARLSAGRTALRRFRESQLRPDAVVPAYVERDFSFVLGGDRIRGRWDRVDIEPLALDEVGTSNDPLGPDQPETLAADIVEPTLPLLARERVTITDYKSSDVRDVAIARKRARDSLQLTIYAMGYQALTGRLPDAVQLHFLETGIVGRAEVDDRRLAAGRELIEHAANGIRLRQFEPKPNTVTCSYCPFRGLCPASAAP